jgi:hypothetical protein
MHSDPPDPPICPTCRESMHHVATMPSLDVASKTVSVFRCEGCERLEWIEE